MEETGAMSTRGGLTLEEFLELPETKPASEYRDGRVTRKVSPQGKHSVLQAAWVVKLNQLAVPGRAGMAFPELRVTFAGRSLVPDVSYISWEGIPREPSGEIADHFAAAPDLAIQVRSPRQVVKGLAESLEFCLQNGSRLGLLVDPYRKQVTVLLPGQPPRVLSKGLIDLSPVLLGRSVTVEEVFGWLVLPR